jgi:hypothetical protein
MKSSHVIQNGCILSVSPTGQIAVIAKIKEKNTEIKNLGTVYEVDKPWLISKRYDRNCLQQNNIYFAFVIQNKIECHKQFLFRIRELLFLDTNCFNVNKTEIITKNELECLVNMTSYKTIEETIIM